MLQDLQTFTTFLASEEQKTAFLCNVPRKKVQGKNPRKRRHRDVIRFWLLSEAHV